MAREIVYLPMNNGGSFCDVNVYQRVNPIQNPIQNYHFPMVFQVGFQIRGPFFLDTPFEGT